MAQKKAKHQGNHKNYGESLYSFSGKRFTIGFFHLGLSLEDAPKLVEISATKKKKVVSNL
ncbi:hypothetical protein [Fibrobacter sp. UWT3]|uniref:hypothetical protein n=1 Tax=Fibrobacter sp. UWT3 TaxID=1896225 RepID=UPI001596B895|nr:hypothetical protein [Fibrobacter sp. UWT3]